MLYRWVSDESASICALCKNRFNQLRRRHHCRYEISYIGTWWFKYDLCVY